MPQIFLNYRREDCPAHAGWLCDTMRQHFGELSVFMDVDTIDPGADFVAGIEHALEDTDIVLALIGDGWLTVRNDDGMRRIDDPADFVRLELEMALARDDVRLVPVLVEGAEMPPAAELPESLRPLAHRNAVSLTDADWRWDTARLVDAIGGDSASSTVGRLWTFPAFLGHGGLAMMYAGLRARKPTWVWFGALYCLPIAGLWTWLHTSAYVPGYAFLVTFVLTAVASLIHVLRIRREYRRRVGDPTRLIATPWVLAGFAGLGGPALVYAGLRIGSKRWLGFGALYCVPTLALLLGLTAPFPGTWWWWCLAAIAALVHIFAVRTEYPVIVKAMGVGKHRERQRAEISKRRRDLHPGRLELLDGPRLDDRL